MVTDVKELLKRSDIRTMKKDIKQLKKAPALEQNKKIQTLPQINKEAEIIKPQKIEQSLLSAPKKSEEIAITPTKPKQKSGFFSAFKLLKKDPNKTATTSFGKAENMPLIQKNITNESIKITAPAQQKELTKDKKIQLNNIQKPNQIIEEPHKMPDASDKTVLHPQNNFKRNPYLEEIPLDIEEEPKVSIKIEEKPQIQSVGKVSDLPVNQTDEKSLMEPKKKKKFMEDVENWVASNKN